MTQKRRFLIYFYRTPISSQTSNIRRVTTKRVGYDHRLYLSNKFQISLPICSLHANGARLRPNVNISNIISATIIQTMTPNRTTINNISGNVAFRNNGIPLPRMRPQLRKC